jgi:hypothetical protein
MPFIVFQSFIGKRHELRRMVRVAGVGLRIVGREDEMISSVTVVLRFRGDGR